MEYLHDVYAILRHKLPAAAAKRVVAYLSGDRYAIAAALLNMRVRQIMLQYSPHDDTAQISQRTRQRDRD